VKISLRFKIRNGLRDIDYERLVESAKGCRGFSIELSPKTDFEHVSLSPVIVVTGDSGLRIEVEVSLAEPIGFEVCNSLETEDETHIDLAVNRRNLRLSKMVTDPTDLERDLNMILRTTERIVNRVCAMFDMQVQRVITLDPESIDTQLEMTLKREELERRGETPKPFGTIHAEGSRDAKDRAGGLIPLYKEHDKTYLYDAKRVYYLLPHEFVVCLLRCNATTMVRQGDFDSRGMEVLRDLVFKKYLKKRELFDGTVCYYGLDGKTRRYLEENLEHRTPRL
jgi:hypothetical protein